MKKKALILATMLTICLTACGNKNNEVVDNDQYLVINEDGTKMVNTQEGITISGSVADCTYVQIESPTECCNEYEAITRYLLTTENASSYEIYKISMYNKNNKSTDPDGDIEITIPLSSAIKEQAGDEYRIYRIDDNNITNVSAKEDGKNIIFKTEADGVYAVVKFDSTGNSNLLFISPGDGGSCSCC